MIGVENFESNGIIVDNFQHKRVNRIFGFLTSRRCWHESRDAPYGRKMCTHTTHVCRI